MQQNTKSEKTGQKPINPKWRKWASNALCNQRIRKGHDCGLTIDQLIAKAPAFCPCCNQQLVPQGHQKNSPTVDRLDSCKGYELDNIWIICHSCNAIKSNASKPSTLYHVADAWYSKLKERKKLCK